jgi:hypothetical protein
VQPTVKTPKQPHVLSEGVHQANVPNIISNLSANGEQAIGPEILLWRYPNHVVNGSLLTVGSSHFCILQAPGTLPNAYETGQHIIQTSDDPLSGSLQLTFDGEPIFLKHEAIYISRANLRVKTNGIVLLHEISKFSYSVDYSISVATREDALRLVEHIPPYWDHQRLHVQDISAYAKPVIEQAMSQLTQSTPLLSVGPQMEAIGLQMQALSQLVRKHLEQFLSCYGITLHTVHVSVSPYNERPNRYEDEIAAIRTELERTRADFSSRIEAHNARLLELSHAISTDSRSSAPVINSRELQMTSGEKPLKKGRAEREK